MLLVGVWRLAQEICSLDDLISVYILITYSLHDCSIRVIDCRVFQSYKHCQMRMQDERSGMHGPKYYQDYYAEIVDLFAKIMDLLLTL